MAKIVEIVSLPAGGAKYIFDNGGSLRIASDGVSIIYTLSVKQHIPKVKQLHRIRKALIQKNKNNN